ncbi:MAG: ArnT family glycosyltransferase, partial [Chloroflexota bacterium]
MTANSQNSDADALTRVDGADWLEQAAEQAGPAQAGAQACAPAGVRRSTFWERVVTLCALLVILTFAGALRLYNVNWDDGHHLHPDERFLAIVGSAIQFPSDPRQYFDTRRSPLNPYNTKNDAFAYGTAPLFLTRFVADRLDMATYDGVPIVGRWLSALADVGTVGLVFMLGRLVYGSRVGLVAAAISATTVVHVQLSHFFAVDTFLAFATTLALYAAYRSWLRGGYLNFGLLGFACGLALATKLSAALLAPIVLLAAVVPPPGGRPRRTPTQMLALLAVCGLVSFLTYRIGEPYSFLGPGFLGIIPNMQRFEDLNRWVKISSGEIEVPFMIQWANTPNPRFALTSLVQWGFGPVAGLTALVGMTVAGLELVQWRRHSINLLLVAWAVINLGYFGFQFAKFMRYFLPVYPALAVLAAYLLVQALPYWLTRLRAPAAVRGLVRYGLPGAVIVVTALYAVAFDSIYSRPNTRITASEWIYNNVPAGSVLGVEHWDDALPLRLKGFEHTFSDVSMNLYDEESPEKVRKLVANLEKADYLILASDRLYRSIPRLPK